MLSTILTVAILTQAPTPASPDNAAAYQAYKSALAAAKARAAQKPLATRARAIASAPELAGQATARKLGITPAALLAIVKEGESKDGTAERKAAAAAKNAVKVEGQARRQAETLAEVAEMERRAAVAASNAASSAVLGAQILERDRALRYYQGRRP